MNFTYIIQSYTLKLNLSGLILAGLFSLSIQAQQLQLQLTSAGGEIVQTANLSGSYTIGEGFILSFKTANNTLTQGFQQSMLLPTSISEQDVKYFFKIYPNPFSDQLYVHNSETSNIGWVTLTDISGRQVNRWELSLSDIGSGGIIRLDTAHVKSGIFIVQIFSDGNQLIQTNTLIKI